MSILLLGGTAEARALAEALVSRGRAVVTSLAGATTAFRAPPGELRVGGFGGVDGLTRYLAEHPVSAVVDATHPFAARISANAAEACARAGVRLLRLSRPGWAEHSEAGRWHWVDSLTEAKSVAENLGYPVFLSIGRHELAVFADWSHFALCRVVDPPEIALPESWEVVRARGPFSLEAERELLRSRGIAVLITKDSGGAATATKLEAAGQLGIAVVIVRRPAQPEGVPSVGTVAEALEWARRTG
jgi:precorrin-6A/cobalt-precorrin-6A reductase